MLPDGGTWIYTISSLGSSSSRALSSRGPDSRMPTRLLSEVTS